MLEVLIASFVLTILLGAIFLIFEIGSRAMLKTESRTDLLQSLQVGVGRWSRELEPSVYGSVTVAPDGKALSFLSASSDLYDGDYAVASNGSLVWQKYLVYYHLSADETLRRVEVPLAPGSPEANAAGPIETYGPALPLSNYLAGGRVVARFVYSCDFVLAPPIVRCRLEARQPKPGGVEFETLSLESRVRLRN